MSEKLSEFEKGVYDFIKARGDVLTSNLPARMRGAIPNLRSKGLVTIFKRPTDRWASKKRKFIRIK